MEVISIKTDSDTKKAAQKLAKDLGLSLSSLINSYLKQVIVTGHVELYAPRQITPQMEKILQGAEDSIQKGEISKDYDDIGELLKDLKSDSSL